MHRNVIVAVLFVTLVSIPLASAEPAAVAEPPSAPANAAAPSEPAHGGEPSNAEPEGKPVVPKLFGGQLVRATTLAGEAAMELGGGGALYFSGTALYWGGGGGRVFQIGESAGSTMVELFHGELLLGYDLIQARRWFVSAMALAGVGLTRKPTELVGIAEGRLAVRRPLARWFMLGAHVAYRRAFGSEIAGISDADLSGPTLGLELYFTH